MILLFFFVSLFFSCKERNFSYYIEERAGRDRIMYSSAEKEKKECIATFFSAVWLNANQKFVLAKKGSSDSFGVWDIELGNWFVEPQFSNSWMDFGSKIPTENGTLWFLPIDTARSRYPKIHIWWFGDDDESFELSLPQDNPYGFALAFEFKNYGLYDPELNLFILGGSGYVLDPTNFQWDHFDQLIKIGGPNLE